MKKTPTKKQRWIQSIIKTAETEACALPFTRGNRKSAAARARAAA